MLLPKDSNSMFNYCFPFASPAFKPEICHVSGGKQYLRNRVGVASDMEAAHLPTPIH